jgi:hypothetical protein
VRAAVELPDELFEAVAERAAEIVLEQQVVAQPDEWLTTERAADYLGRSKGHLHNLGPEEIPFEQPAGQGGRRYYRRSALDAYLASRGELVAA